MLKIILFQSDSFISLSSFLPFLFLSLFFQTGSQTSLEFSWILGPPRLLGWQAYSVVVYVILGLSSKPWAHQANVLASHCVPSSLFLWFWKLCDMWHFDTQILTIFYWSFKSFLNSQECSLFFIAFTSKYIVNIQYRNLVSSVVVLDNQRHMQLLPGTKKRHFPSP